MTPGVVTGQEPADVLADHGCLACHTIDGSPGPATTFSGLFGSSSTVVTGGVRQTAIWPASCSSAASPHSPSPACCTSTAVVFESSGSHGPHWWPRRRCCLSSPSSPDGPGSMRVGCGGARCSDWPPTPPCSRSMNGRWASRHFRGLEIQNGGIATIAPAAATVGDQNRGSAARLRSCEAAVPRDGPLPDGRPSRLDFRQSRALGEKPC